MSFSRHQRLIDWIAVQPIMRSTITMTDPETGRRRFVHTSSAKMRDEYAQAASQQREDNRRHIRAAGADHLVLRTDRDWVADLIRHVALRRTGQTTGRRP